MVDTIENAPSDSPAFERKAQSRPACFHCGEPCDLGEFERNDKNFCCHGCLTVHELLIENGLGHFYDLRSHPGIRMRKSVGREKWAYLDQAEVWQKLVDFSDKKLTKVTFRIPSIHCLACVWLLENLFQLHSAIGRGTVNFLKREAAISFETGKIKFSELVGLLSSIGYEPELNLGELEQGKDKAIPARKKQWLQIGVAGFAFGNIMLFSLPLYLGLDSSSGPAFKQLVGWLSLILALPVLTYSATDYWRSAWVSLRQRVLTLDVPIALGLAAIYGQSLYEISRGIGAGYCDSLTGLIFFLLCGRFFQQTTYNRMAFDRDYKCFFPLSVVRRSAGGEETISISNLQPGDRLILRQGELIPADSKLISGEALLDYSFVSGESAPVSKTVGDYLYAGGQQIGAAIELETIKAVSQSYLTSLWNDEAFKKDREDQLNTLTNRYSRRFTRIVLGVAVGAALFWWWTGEPARGFKALVSVLIVACPCALALAAPFASGTAQRILGLIQVFLKNAFVLERMAQVTTIVFDKTGTLTSRANGLIVYPNSPTEAGLTPEEKSAVASLVRNSTHPHASGIAESLADYDAIERVRGFQEVPGRGIAGEVSSIQVVIGSSKWLDSFGICAPSLASLDGSVSYLAVGGVYRGRFILKAEFRRELKQLIECLPEKYEIALLSGDNDNDRDRFQLLFGPNSRLLFNQTPADKLAFIRTLQGEGKRVMMVGDGLNDAGALKQSDVGIAVVEKVGSFSPASDVILEAGQVSQLFKILTFARRSTLVVRLSFIISALYNLVGIGIAAAGFLSPLVCAILMPLSSVSVVLFSCGATTWMASRLGLCTTPSFPSLKKA